MTDTQRIRIKKHLEMELRRLEQTETVPVVQLENCPDEVDMATQINNRNLSVAILDRRVQQARELEVALERIFVEDFGICNECGGEIGIARLMARPGAKLCVNCQSDRDRQFRACA